MPRKILPLPEMSGVYQIRNLVNGNIYIGSSTNIRKRRKNHLNMLKLGKHSSRILQRAFDKHGKDNFEFSVLELCEPSIRLEREQFYIDLLSPKYNSMKVVSIPPMMGRKHSQESLKKMSLSQRNKPQSFKDKISNSIKILWSNPEDRKKFLENRKYQNLGKKLSPDKVKEIRLLWETGNYSTPEIAKMFGVNRATAYYVVNRITWKWVK